MKHFAALLSFLALPLATARADDAPAEAVAMPPAEETLVEAALVEQPDAPATWARPAIALPEDGVANIYVIPVHDVIGKTNLYTVRRGLKEAIANGAEVIVLDMDTPGGRGDIMLDIMDMVDKYEGRTIAYVNTEAVSAGAFISAAADDIYFAPGGLIGAAAVINSDGSDIADTLKAKIDSYMDARLRSITDDNPRRADVIRAMRLENYELVVDGVKVEYDTPLLSLTATEAMRLYGNPPTPLLGSGIYESVEALALAEYGEGRFEIRNYEQTWSESAALYMEKIAPVLIGLGMLCLVIEFYTPGFGLPGIAGLSLLAIVFISNYIAGLAGHEPLIFFGLGLILLLVELILLPGTLFLAITGILLMIGSLVWSLADVWPKSGGGVEIDYGNVGDAFGQVLLGIFIAAAIFAVIFRYLPKNWFFGRLVLETATSGTAPAAVEAAQRVPAGSRGVAVTNLRPGGTVEIDGERHEASLAVGSAEKGERVVVCGVKNGVLIVDKV